jgi:hypothetical protein
MTKPNLLNTRTATFLDLMGNGKIYHVPAYQRDYSWDEEQWEDLWNDILELQGNKDERHYMGALVVEGKSDREFLIIDGQQRLATLSILALAIIKYLSNLDIQDDQQRARVLQHRFIGEKDPVTLIYGSKLRLNETDDGFYQDYLVQLRPPENPRGLKQSNKLLWACFNWFLKKIENAPEFQSNGSVLAELLNEVIAGQLLFILITVDNELNAYMLFETLNARRLELTSTDLLKNYLFSKVNASSGRDALQRRWNSLVGTVKQERFPEFLRYHLLCELPNIKLQRLFKVVRDKVKTPKEVFDLLTALEQRAELFTAIFDTEHEYWIDTPDAKPYIREISLFKIKQMMPLIFAAWEKFTKEAFVQVLQLISVVSFRYSIISGLNPNVFDSVYPSAAKAVLDETAKKPRQVFEKLKSIYIPDEKFIQAFAGKDTIAQRKKLVKYILCKLESHASTRDYEYQTDPGTIEHILPENASPVWEKTFPVKKQDSFIYRLGNLTLLETKKNKALGNKDYQAKCSVYKTSNYVLTKKIAVDSPNEWSPAQLENRQQALAKQAAQIWRSNFE